MNVIVPLGVAFVASAPPTLAESRTGDPAIAGFGDAVTATEGARCTGASTLNVVEAKALSPLEATILQPIVTVPVLIPCVLNKAVLPLAVTDPMDAL
jgi:hypothetical protein